MRTTNKLVLNNSVVILVFISSVLMQSTDPPKNTTATAPTVSPSLLIASNSTSASTPELTTSNTTGSTSIPTAGDNSVRTSNNDSEMTKASVSVAQANEGDSICSLGGTDSVGQHLGCNCVMLTGGIVSAQCVDKWIGYNGTMQLGPNINISRHVRIVDFSKNQISSLQDNTFGDCEGVSELIFSENQIVDVGSLNCRRLQKLDLSRNMIENIADDAFVNLKKLQVLNLGFNRLLTINKNVFLPLEMIRVLNLESNLLGDELMYYEEYSFSLAHLPSLEELDVSNNSLMEFPGWMLNGTSKLRKLVLKNNKLSSLPMGLLHQLQHLKNLDLSENHFEVLSSFEFLGLRGLHYLTLDRLSLLETIQEHAFAGLISLKEISCQKNGRLNFIDPLAFRGSEEVEAAGDSEPRTVRLGDNNLNYIEYGLLHWKDLEMLELYRNPWICDCNLQWVPEFQRSKPEDAALLQDSDFSCAEPHIMAGVPVYKVNPEEMLCFSPAATVAGTVGIILFGFLLFSFCSIIVLNQMGMLPDWVRKYNIFGSGSSLPNYMRVNPKPTRARRLDRLGFVDKEMDGEPSPGELEWDTSGDIGQPKT